MTGCRGNGAVGEGAMTSMAFIRSSFEIGKYGTEAPQLATCETKV
jgi:hypothetical protein